MENQELEQVIGEIFQVVSTLEESQLREVYVAVKLESLEGKSKLALKRQLPRYVHGEDLEGSEDAGVGSP